MKISEVKNLEPGAKGIDAEGRLRSIYGTKVRTNPISKKKEYNQFCVLDDGDQSIGLNLVGINVSEANKNKPVSIKNASLRTYLDKEDKPQFVLDVISPDGALIMSDGTPRESSKPEEKVSALVEIFKILGETADLMTLPATINILKSVKEAGWTSEDLRALMITVFLDRKRG